MPPKKATLSVRSKVARALGPRKDVVSPPRARNAVSTATIRSAFTLVAETESRGVSSETDPGADPAVGEIDESTTSASPSVISEFSSVSAALPQALNPFQKHVLALFEGLFSEVRTLGLRIKDIDSAQQPIAGNRSSGRSELTASLQQSKSFRVSDFFLKFTFTKYEADTIPSLQKELRKQLYVVMGEHGVHIDDDGVIPALTNGLFDVCRRNVATITSAEDIATAITTDTSFRVRIVIRNCQ